MPCNIKAFRDSEAKKFLFPLYGLTVFPGVLGLLSVSVVSHFTIRFPRLSLSGES